MSRRRPNSTAIRGPQSALTDFLASHNISAQQINLDYQQRVRDAEQQAAQAAAAAAADDEDKENEGSDEEDAVERKKRKRKEEKAIAKIKASKEFKKRKFEQYRDDPDASDDSDALARSMLSKPKAPPKPGQFANCEICEKRFTVTPYTISGPDGGLLCTKCGKEIKDEKKKADNAAKKKQAPKARKRQTESDRMMGDVKPGAKSLVEHCVRKVADVVNDIEEFGDLPQSLLDRLSQILSKKRVLTPRTLQLFLQPGVDRIAVYDCAKLESEDFDKIFAYMPDVERVDLRFAGQLKDDSLRYMIEKNSKITHLRLGATNLVSDAAWCDLFQTRGSKLESLKLSELNDAMHDDTIQVMAASCTSLKRLKLRSCPHMTEVAIRSISQIPSLEHLTLAVGQDASADTLMILIESLGPRLRTLCLENYHNMDDTVLQSIKDNCTRLQKLRLTGGSSFTDAMFASLFDSTWSNPALPYIDLSCNRDLDADVGPDDDPVGDEPIGVATHAFKALFQHSGARLEQLDLHSCRHISKKALMYVFDGEKQYPNIKDMDLSFVTHLDDFCMTGIFKSCPALQKLAVFACFSVKDIVIPRGIAVIGLPTAQTAVEVVGEA